MPRLTKPPGIPREVEAVVDVLGSLPRSKILHELGTGPKTTAALAETVRTSGVSVLRHLRDLEAAGLVEADVPPGERSGRRNVQWSVNGEALTAALDTHARYLRGE